MLGELIDHRLSSSFPMEEHTVEVVPYYGTNDWAVIMAFDNGTKRMLGFVYKAGSTTHWKLKGTKTFSDKEEKKTLYATWKLAAKSLASTFYYG